MLISKFIVKWDMQDFIKVQTKEAFDSWMLHEDRFGDFKSE